MCFEEYKSTNDDDGTRNRGEGRAHAATLTPFDLCCPVINEICNQDIDCDHHLEDDVEHAAEFRGNHLREVDGHILVGEADADS
ncbi:hypothetical protein IEQ34_021923 [Dendrobium chrysotoxum]|uniref:Uncharacterized protein n=1 Tax=Dendrobium chrysotoxum TaxID=161865 RepID=A0AAV7FXC1_DENCH|nr:hypothetical protein IEQ34_021923 [Dendrobium chrysotoxum]